jgi:Uma2 family endonuclease
MLRPLLSVPPPSPNPLTFVVVVGIISVRPKCGSCGIEVSQGENHMATKPQGRTQWDYEAYAGISYDGKRHEIIDGEHYVNPAPSLYHQQVSRRMQFQLYTAIELAELGVVINAPVDVQLTDHDIVQPDLVIIRKAKSYIMTPTKVKGIPDLLVEILSPSNPSHDLRTKRQAYEKSGVPEYWIAFPEEHYVLRLTLVDGAYQEEYCQDEISFNLPPLVKVDLRRVW